MFFWYFFTAKDTSTDVRDSPPRLLNKTTININLKSGNRSINPNSPPGSPGRGPTPCPTPNSSPNQPLEKMNPNAPKRVFIFNYIIKAVPVLDEYFLHVYEVFRKKQYLVCLSFLKMIFFNEVICF